MTLRVSDRELRWLKLAILRVTLIWTVTDLLRILWSMPDAGETLIAHAIMLVCAPLVWTSVRYGVGLMYAVTSLGPSGKVTTVALGTGFVFFASLSSLALLTKVALVVRGLDEVPGTGPLPQVFFLLPASWAYFWLRALARR